MKLFKFTMAVLLVLCLTAVSAFSEVIWSEDFESYEAGTEIVGTVEGWKYYNPAEYSGTSTVVADGSGKVIKLSRVESQATNAYDMVLTPAIKLAPDEPVRKLVKISFRFKPGSKTDLFALYGVKGEEVQGSDRYFYLHINGESKEVSTDPGGAQFTNLTTDYNDCYIVVDYQNKKIVSINLNGESKDYNVSFGENMTEDVVLRLSTQYESFISADEAAYYDYVQVETISRSDEPSIYAPDTVYMGAKGKFTMYNAGPDATINYTISTEADWLTITPNSGELTTSKDINLRSSKPRGFYKTTLTIDGGEYGSKTVNVVCQNDVVYATDFEEFELGNIVTQSETDEWVDGYGHSPADGEAVVINGGYDGSEKCLRVHAGGLYAPHINFGNTENHSSSNNFRVSFMLKVENLVGNQGNSGIFFNSTDGLGEIALYNAEGGCRIEAKNDANFATTNVCALGEWIPISYVLNTTKDNIKLLEFQFGDCIYSNLDRKISSDSTQYDRFRYFRFFIWGNDTSVLMDNFKIEYESRQSVDNKISITGTKTFDIFATNGTLTVFNEGSIDTKVTIESPFDFLTIGGETKVVTNVVANSSLELTIDLDRSNMGNDYYVNQIKVSNDTMTLYQPVMIQSGVEGEGYTFYKSYFDTLEEGIDIRELDPAWVTGYGDPPLCPITEKAGAKALALNYNAYNALHCTIKSPTGLSESYNYRISFAAYIPAGWDGTYYNYYVGFQTDGGTYFEQNLEGNADGFVTLSNMGNKPDLGKWFDVSYTFNILPSNEKHLETTFDGVTSNLNYNINFGDKDHLTYWRFFGWCGGDAAPIYIKDVVIEAVARPDSGPTLEVGRIGQVFYQDRDKDTELTVINSGKGNLSFSAEVSEGSGWLSIRAADPETGILEDTIESMSSKKYILDIDREAIGNTYAHGKITVTGAGSTEVVDLYVQGYDDTGITFYYSDFEETPFGVINRVDPAWLHDLAEVVEEDGNKCMKLQGGGGPLHAKVNVPDGLYDDYNFKVSCRVKVSRQGVPQLTFGANRRQGEYTLNCDENNQVYFTIVDSANQDAVSNTIPAGEWFDMSYTFNSDPLNRRTVSVQFGDEFYELNDPNTNPDCVDSYFEEFRFYIWDNAEPYFVDDFRIEAVGRPNIPPVMVTTLQNVPVSYAADEFEVKVTNAGGNSFHFTAAPGPGVDYLNIPTNTFEVKGACRMTVGIDRSKLGYGFYRPTIRFTTDIEGQETVDIALPIQSGTPEQGYVLYASEFANLHTTKEEGGKVVDELSEQDSCWIRSTSHNRADVVVDPTTGKKVVKIINANDWSTYSGYQLNLGVPAEAAQDYDVVYSMDVNIPKSYVTRPESEHPDAFFYISQVNGNRQCEAFLYLDEEQSALPVQIGLSDITNTNWWEEHVETADPVESASWFRFYMRFSTKLIDFDHKNLFAITFGSNEYHMEGNDSDLTYPGGISQDQLDREDLTKLKLWSYCDDADILIDNVNILLVPKGLPEPALFGILALLALAFVRKQR